MLIINVSNRTKKEKALYTWLRCTDASQAPRFWSKTVTHILLYDGTDGGQRVCHMQDLSSSFRRWDWLCGHKWKHSSPRCCQIRSGVADQYSADQRSCQRQVSLSGWESFESYLWLKKIIRNPGPWWILQIIRCMIFIIGCRDELIN